MRHVSRLFFLSLAGILAVAACDEVRSSLTRSTQSATSAVSPEAQIVDKGTSAFWGGAVSLVQSSHGDPTHVSWEFADGSPVETLCSNTAGGAVPSCLTHCTLRQFDAVETFATGAGQDTFALTELNGDGLPDLVIANGTAVGVLLGNGSGGYGAKATFGSGGSGPMVATDLNGDGRKDLAIVSGAAQVSTLLGNGDGTFGPHAVFPAGPANVDSLVVADFNEDGTPDIAVGNSPTGTPRLSLLIGNGDGSFGPPITRNVTASASIATADVNLDGHADILMAGVTVTNVWTILYGNGTGAFPTFADRSSPGYITDFELNDFDGDGLVDVAMNAGGNLLIAINDGTGLFGSAYGFFRPGSGRGLASGDLNGDGAIDLVSPATGIGAVSVFLNKNLGNGIVHESSEYDVGLTPSNIELADLNGDGDLDVTVGNSVSSRDYVSVLRGNGAGGLGGQTRAELAGTPSAILLADLDNDAKRDLVVTSQSLNQVFVGFGNGNTSFRTIQGFATGARPRDVAAGDFDKNGAADLVVVNEDADTASVLLATTAGTFAPKVDYPTGDNPAAVAVADLNTDGNADFVVVNLFTRTVSVMLGNGVGGFAPKVDYATGTGPRGVAVDDFNEDGLLDVATAASSEGNVSVLLGAGGGNLGAKTDFPAGQTGVAIATADFDANGHRDIVVANLNPNTASVLLGAGNGTFAAPLTFPTQSNPNSVATGDFNGDGNDDFVVSNSVSRTLSIFLGRGDGTFSPRSDMSAGVSYFPYEITPKAVTAADLNGDGFPDIAVANANGEFALVISIRPTWSCPANTTHAYFDSKGAGAGPSFTYPVKLSLGATRVPFEREFPVTVVDVPPAVSATTYAVPEGATAVVSGSWTHPCTNDAYVTRIDWGDGTFDDYPSGVNVKNAAGSHLYPNDGAYTISVTVTDDEGTASAPLLLPTEVIEAPPVIASVHTNAPVEIGQPATVWVVVDSPAGDAIVYDFDWNGDGVFGGGDDVVGSTSSSSSLASASPRILTVNVRVRDDDGNAATGQVGVQWVTDGGGTTNDPPIALDRGFSTSEATPLSVSLTTLLAGSFDPNGDVIAFASTTQPLNGTVAVASSTLTYTPSGAFNGDDTFYYSITDTFGAIGTGLVTVTVTPVEHVPLTGPDSLVTLEDVAISVARAELLANDSDPDGAPLSLTSVGTAMNGAVSTSGENITFVSAPGFNGDASFTYTVSDGTSTAIGNVSVSVLPVNDPPAAGDDLASTAEDTPATIPTSMLFANDADPDGDALTLASVSQPAHGAVAVQAGSLVYTPDANFHGDDTLTYSVSDGNGGLATAAVAMTVGGVNDAPIATADTTTAMQDQPLLLAAATLLANDADVDGDALAITAVGSAQNGSASISGSNITFVPAAGMSGTATFVYSVSDGTTTSSAPVTVTVLPVDLGPGAPTIQDPPLGSSVPTLTPTLTVSNAVDSDGDPLTYRFQVSASPLFQSDVLDSGDMQEGAGTTSWTTPPLADYTTDYWRALATDGLIAGDWTTSTFFVSSANSPPTAPTPLNPANGVLVADTTPTLTTSNSTDLQSTTLTYEFEIRRNDVNGDIIESITGIAEGEDQTSATLTMELRRGTRCAWRARAIDGDGAVGEWSVAAEFEVYADASRGGCACDVSGESRSSTVLSAWIGFVALLLSRRRNHRHRVL